MILHRGIHFFYLRYYLKYKKIGIISFQDIKAKLAFRHLLITDNNLHNYKSKLVKNLKKFDSVKLLENHHYHKNRFYLTNYFLVCGAVRMISVANS